MKAKPLILVVEDEVIVRLFAVEIARAAGFEAISVATADAAITILEERPDVRLVFTDVNIPGSMDGIRLAQAVRERWPPVELIVTSGRGEILVEDLPERGRFLAKPYDAATLTRTLMEMAKNV
jgi:CheY-like chemotaxis protein